MLRIPGGSFTRQEKATDWPGAISIVQKVTLTRPFLLCDRELSVGQFQQFVDDPDYPGKEKASAWPGADSVMSPTTDHPVQRVDWNDAVLYCNWLSRSMMFITSRRHHFQPLSRRLYYLGFRVARTVSR